MAIRPYWKGNGNCTTIVRETSLTTEKNSAIEKVRRSGTAEMSAGLSGRV